MFQKGSQHHVGCPCAFHNNYFLTMTPEGEEGTPPGSRGPSGGESQREQHPRDGSQKRWCHAAIVRDRKGNRGSLDC